MNKIGTNLSTFNNSTENNNNSTSFLQKNNGFINFSKENKINNSKILNLTNYNNNFISLGIFSMKINNSNKKLYYDLFYRRIYLDSINYVDDYFFNDITDLINYRKIISQENLKKEKIFAKIAHEFKTPLNSIMGIILNIRDSDQIISEITNNKLEIVNSLSNYLIFLISDIIHYVNINDLDYIKINYSTINLKEILNFSFHILNSLLCCNKNKNQNIISEISIAEDLEILDLNGDEIRLKQILLNFISNAVKFTKEGKIIIKCKIKKKENETFIKITVKDSGIGIKSDDQKYLFEDFKMLKNEDNDISNSLGSGLGLSICKLLAEKMSYNLSYKSNYMKGSSFIIKIPYFCKSSNNKINLSTKEICEILEKDNYILNIETEKVLDKNYEKININSQGVYSNTCINKNYHSNNLEKSLNHDLNKKNISTRCINNLVNFFFI